MISSRVQNSLVVGGSCLLTAHALAQGVLAPLPAQFGPQVSPYQAMAAKPFATVPGEAPTPSLSVPPWLEWGPVIARPHLLYRFSYGNGIQPEPGHQTVTAIHEFSPGLALQLGSHWTLDYTPTLRYYSSKQFRNTVDHSVALTGGTTYEDWLLAFSQSYASASEPLIETGAQTDTDTYSTGLNAVGHLSSAVSLELSLSQVFEYVGQGQAGQQLGDSKEWSTLDWVNYEFGPKIGAAVGVGFGYIDVQAGSDMTFEQLQGRITARPGEKLSFVLSGGVDIRQFLDSDESDLVNPILLASAEYHLFEPSTLFVNAARAVDVAYLQNAVTESTSVSGGVRQRLLKHVNLEVTGGYTATSYQAGAATGLGSREDDYTFVGVRLSVAVLKRGRAGVFYQHSNNSSNELGFGYTSDQGGVELEYRF